MEREERVAAIRAFNRFYTSAIGVLQAAYLQMPYSVTEARVLYEAAQVEALEVSRLRRLLGVDGGYLSRVLTHLESEGLITKTRSPEDGRRQVLRLTAEGRGTFDTLNARSAADIQQWLDGVPEEHQRRLVGAMATIRDILSATPRPEAFVIRAPYPGDLGWVVQRHGALYADEYGWDDTFEALVARIVADYVDHRDPRREAAWIAEVDGQPMGCVFCVRKDEGTAQLRLLLVDPEVRGLGMGSRLIGECLAFARRAGYRRLMLWTNDVLTEARRLYERAGFALLTEERHHSFGHDLVGQIWEREL